MIARIISERSFARAQPSSCHPASLDISMSSTRAWLSPEIFHWRRSHESEIGLDEREWRRAYDHFMHAEEVLRGGGDALSRVDVISTLKRCLNQRLQHLKSAYQLDGISFPRGPTRLLDKLAELGVVRPFLLEHLMQVRNRIEHSDVPPPSHRRCSELTDVVWYFLRSTDQIAKFRPGTLFFEESTADLGSEFGEYGLVLDARAGHPWQLNVNGWLSPKWISTRRHPARVEINCTIFEREEKRRAVRRGASGSHRRKPGMVAFRGTVIGPPDAVIGFIKTYFDL